MSFENPQTDKPVEEVKEEASEEKEVEINEDKEVEGIPE